MYDYMMFWLARDLVKVSYFIGFLSLLLCGFFAVLAVRSMRQHWHAFRMRNKRHPEYVKMANEILYDIEWATRYGPKAGIKHTDLKYKRTLHRPIAYAWLFDKVIDDLYESHRIQADIDASNDVTVYYLKDILAERLDKVKAEIEDRKENPKKYTPRKRASGVRPLTPRKSRW